MTATAQLTLSVEGMTCASCVARVERALSAVAGTSDVAVNLASETARLTLSEPSRALSVVQALSAAGYAARTEEVTLSIASMTCASCVGRVDRALAAVPGVVSVSVNLASETARVQFLDGAVRISDLTGAVAAIGYQARLAGPRRSADHSARKEAEARDLARKTLLAAALTTPVFLLEMAGHVVPSLHHLIARTIGMQASWLIQLVLTTLVLVGPGRGFYLKGFAALIRLAPDMNSLVAIGTGAAYGYSVVATFAPGLLPEGSRAVYFEAAAVIVVLILLGRFLEARAKGRTGSAIQGLLGLQARVAHVRRGDQVLDLPTDDILPGDVLLVRPGERIATDGEVTAGRTQIDESMITGEPEPVTKTLGARVTGGTVNGAASFEFRATRVGADTTLAQIIRMVEQAQGAKLPIQGLVDRITLWFVPAVMAVAAVAVLVWLLAGPSLSMALVAGVSVLIIACPCAMGLATPTSIMVGMGRAAELGVLFRKGDALQALSDVDVVAMDKTGTLTAGRPELTDLVLSPGFERAEVLRAVGAVESRSEHSIAAAITRAATREGLSLPEVEDFTSITGYGVSARIDGRRVLVGADRLMTREGVDIAQAATTEAGLAAKGRTALFAAIDGKIAAVIAVSDPLKPSSLAAVRALQAQGRHVAMITGDKEATARVIAAELGIDEVIAGVLPGGKVAALDRLRAGGRRLAFVGDGINDAPALAHADVGIAIGTGTDVAIESADVVLMSGDLSGVNVAFEVSRRTLANIRQNLIWAFGYNIALIPVAAGVLYPAFGLLLSPALAAGAMGLSSVFVLSNALRLRRIVKEAR